jgi:hypothetical protein
MMENKKRSKYDVGDTVRLKGYKEDFKITEWFFECSLHHEDGYHERSSYTLRGLTTGKFLDFIDEEDEDLVVVERVNKEEEKEEEGEEEILEEVFTFETYSKPLSQEEIDYMLDKYNDFMSTHLLIKHMGFDETEYRDMANQIVAYLSTN